MCKQEQAGWEVKSVLEQLVALTINQDHVVQGWQKFLITIETALAVAFSSLVVFFNRGGIPSWFLKIFFALLPILGIAAAIVLTVIILIERKWQKWYVQQTQALPPYIPRIFPEMPEDWTPAKSVRELPMDRISKLVLCLTIGIVIFWGVVFVSALSVKLEKNTAGSSKRQEQVETTRTSRAAELERSGAFRDDFGKPTTSFLSNKPSTTQGIFFDGKCGFGVLHFLDDLLKRF